MAKVPLDYATAICFDFLSSSDPDADVLRDMHCFMGLPIFRATYDESSSIHQPREGQCLLHDKRLLSQLWENSSLEELYRLSQGLCQSSSWLVQWPNAQLWSYIFCEGTREQTSNLY